jgi:hypothetical protein
MRRVLLNVRALSQDDGMIAISARRSVASRAQLANFVTRNHEGVTSRPLQRELEAERFEHE